MAEKLTIAIVVAAGRGERAGDGMPKQYRPIGGKSMLSWTLEAFLGAPGIDLVLPVIHQEHRELYAGLSAAHERLLAPVSGGATRQASVLAGLLAIAERHPAQVLIHDAARPFVPQEVIAGVLAALEEAEAVLPALPVTDTIKRAPDGKSVSGTEERSALFAAQTPQGFRFPAIFEAHRRAASLPQDFTDDAAVAEWAGLKVILTPGSARNVKITRPEDFAAAERHGGTEMETRVGSGFDVHPFEPGDAVWLGGVRIAHDARLKGHSDADAGLHALADALYGALGEGDIGTHFPPSDPQWQGAASAIFLSHAAGRVAARGGRIVNLDLTLVCEAPRIAPHVAAMRAAIAEAAGISADRVAVKATTSERLGFTGRKEGLVALATASVEVPRTP